MMALVQTNEEYSGTKSCQGRQSSCTKFDEQDIDNLKEKMPKGIDDKQVSRHDRKLIHQKEIHGRPFSTYELKELSHMGPEEMVCSIYLNVKAFREALQKPSKVEDLLGIIHKASSIASTKAIHTKHNELGHKALTLLGEVFSGRSSVFQLSLRMYINDINSDTMKNSVEYVSKLKSICSLFIKLLELLPDSSWSVLPIHELKAAMADVEQLPQTHEGSSNESSSIKGMMQDLSLYFESAKEHYKKTDETANSTNQKWNDSSYKQIPIIPRWGEILVADGVFKSKPRKIIVKGSYNGWLHYLDIHFRLLREDFISPLRKGIECYFQGLKGRKLKNIRVYEKVTLVTPFWSDSGMCYRVKLDVSRFHRKWIYSKRLIFGSLLCLSHDDFKDHIFFATVINRDIEDIQKGFLDILLREDFSIVEFSEKTFKMVESCAYFEGSQHILRSLQKSEPKQMPFTKYIISGDCKNVNLPKYLRRHEDSAKAFVVKNISEVDAWPAPELINLDQSQMAALQSALTQEVAIIQGPPGTGKTYIGVRIVEALLNNASIWSPHGTHSPILVMCFTNHALDQFLEEILKCHTNQDVKMVRVGGRSKSEVLNQLNLRTMVKRTYIPKEYLKEKYEAKRKVECCKNSVRQRYSDYADSATKYIHMNSLNECMHPHHQIYFCGDNEEVNFLFWLGMLRHYTPNPLFLPSQLATVKEDVGSTTQMSLAAHTNRYGHSSQNCKESDDREEQPSDDDDYISIIYDMESQNRLIDDGYDSDYNDGYAPQSSKLELERQSYNENKSSLWPINHNLPEGYIDIDWERCTELINSLSRIAPMDEKEALGTQDLHNLSSLDRLRLYKYWHCLYRTHLRKECIKKFKEYNSLCEELEKAMKLLDQYALTSTDVIGMTTTGAAKYQHILHSIKPSIVIVEEAAEVLESHIVSSLNAATQHLILIGDHKQLRPKPNDHDLAKKHNLDISLFERLIINGHPHVTLNVQHRMRPEIAQLVCPHIYDMLVNHSSVMEYPAIRGVSTNLFFINHDEREQSDDYISSHSNRHEATFLVAFCKYLLQQNYSPSQITILVTYTGQLLAMKKMMPKQVFEGVKLCSVDNYQGEENDIILLSLVRSNSDNQVGFLKEENRICVALSRARQGFYCIGNFEMLRSKVTVWEKIAAAMNKLGKFGDEILLVCNNHPKISFKAKNPEDFRAYSPYGGCRNPCKFRLPCGHVCEELCHTNDPKHLDYVCTKPCIKKCLDYGHPCKRRCFEVCKCTANVKKQLKCGHDAKILCHLKSGEVKCKVRITRLLPCEHDISILCYQSSAEAKCMKNCSKKCPKNKHLCPLLCFQKCKPCQVGVVTEMPNCHHKQRIKCWQDPSTENCMNKCQKKCSKGHSCPNKCFEACGDCSHPCEEMLQCDHQCTRKCYEQCTESCEETMTQMWPCGHILKRPCCQCQQPEKFPCKEICGKLLPCTKHTCSNKCGMPCIEKCKVKVPRALPCGHNVIRACFKSDIVCHWPCQKKLKCGHPCPNQCGVECSKICFMEVEKQYSCGHLVKVACSTAISELPCAKCCHQKLLCGHNCKGKCGLCLSRNIHKPCGFSVKFNYFCGHHTMTPCIGLTNEMCKGKLKISCTHGSHEESCLELPNYLNCTKLCDWKCKHLSCSKLCSELCDRPQCDERCDKVHMSCGHQCYGLCGEPCLSICPKCNRIEFEKRLQFSHFDSKLKYYELQCKHMFTVKYLDEYSIQFRKSDSPVLVGPLVCPIEGCNMLFHASFRYGNIVKICFSRMSAVNDHIRHNTAVNCDALKLINMLYTETMGSIVPDSNSLFAHSKFFTQLIGVIMGFKNHLLRNEVNREEIFLIFISLKLLQLAKTADAIVCNNMKLEDVAQYLFLIFTQYKARLTVNVLNDMERLYLKCCLTVLCFVLRCKVQSECESCNGLDNAEIYLKEEHKISRNAFQFHMTAMSKSSLFKSIFTDTISDKILSDIATFRPAILKGIWWCCKDDHYYCTPASICDFIHECPDCRGTYDDYCREINPSSDSTAPAGKALQRYQRESRKRSSPQGGFDLVTHHRKTGNKQPRLRDSNPSNQCSDPYNFIPLQDDTSTTHKITKAGLKHHHGTEQEGTAEHIIFEDKRKSHGRMNYESKVQYKHSAFRTRRHYKKYDSFEEKDVRSHHTIHRTQMKDYCINENPHKSSVFQHPGPNTHDRSQFHGQMHTNSQTISRLREYSQYKRNEPYKRLSQRFLHHDSHSEKDWLELTQRGVQHNRRKT